MAAPRASRGHGSTPAAPGGPEPAPGTPRGSGALPRTSLYAQVLLARIWLPIAIVLVVLVYQTVVVPMGGETWAFWTQVLFYGIVGPTVTAATLTWIATEVRERERAQIELQRLYGELQDSYASLGVLQRVTEQFASASDLEGLVVAAGSGVREVTGAAAAAVVVAGAVRVEAAADVGREELERRAREVDASLRTGGEGETEARWSGGVLVSLPLRWGGSHEGSLHAAFLAGPPGEKARETLRIVAADLAAAAEAVQGRTRDLITLFEVDRSIRAEGNLDRMLSALVGQLAARADAGRAGIYLLEDGLLELRAAVERESDDAGQREPAAPAEAGQGERPVPSGPSVRSVPSGPSVRALPTQAPPVPVGSGVVGRGASATGPELHPSITDDDRTGGGPVLEGAGSAVVLPIGVDGARVGVIALAHPARDHFSPASLPFLDLLAGQVRLAVGNANAYRQSEELAIAEERARIAREIHDGVAQSLAFVALKLDLAGRLIGGDPGAAEREVADAKRTVRETIREVRRSIFALRPIDLERHGFVGTLQRYVHDFGAQNDLLVELSLGELPELSMNDEAVLFRIFQEAMNNVAKHARARTVRVAVGRDGDGQVAITVNDDGVGFDPGAVADRVSTAGGLGLRQMRERVEARGGSFRVDSAPGSGTTLRASVPA